MIREESETLPTYRARLLQRLIESGVPENLREGLQEYIAIRRPVGGFLTAVLSNDLGGACGRIDVDARPHLFDVVFFLYNYAPAMCWGSPEKVAAWLTDLNPAPEIFE